MFAIKFVFVRNYVWICLKYNLHIIQSSQVQRQGENVDDAHVDQDGDHVGQDIETKSQFQTEDRWRVLSLGQFFFVKIWPANNDLLSVAELQLLWEDKVGDAGHHDDDHDHVWMLQFNEHSLFRYMFPRNGGKTPKNKFVFRNT